MANSDKNIVVTPNKGSSSADPKIEFSGASSSSGAQTITARVYPTNSGTVSFEGSTGQLFSINNNLSGTIFSINDISGMPALEVYDTGKVKLTGGQVPRIYSTTSTTSLPVNSDLYDTLLVTSLVSNISIANDTGTPYDGQRLLIRITAAGSSYSIGFANGFRYCGVSPPASSTNGYTYYYGCVYNALISKWDIIAHKNGN